MTAQLRFLPPAERPAREPRASGHVTFLGEFARELARHGIAVDGPALQDAAEAIRLVGANSRNDLYWALHAVFVTRRSQSAAFKRAFDRIWPR